MSLFPSPHSTRPPHSILSATLSAKSSQSLLAASNGKGKLGFSIDSIVGDGSPAREVSPEARGRSQSPIQTSPRDRSPIYRVRSPSPPDDCRRSPSPSTSPPSPSLVRPIPTSLTGSPGLSTQSYLDQLQQLKAFYEARGGGAPGLGSVTSSASAGSALLPPGLSIPGLHPAAVLSALPRPPNMPGALPPFLGLPGQPHGLPGQPLPREYPLYPWFINRHRFPGGETDLSFICLTVTGLSLRTWLKLPGQLYPGTIERSQNCTNCLNYTRQAEMRPSRSDAVVVPSPFSLPTSCCRASIYIQLWDDWEVAGHVAGWSLPCLFGQLIFPDGFQAKMCDLSASSPISQFKVKCDPVLGALRSLEDIFDVSDHVAWRMSQIEL